MDHLASALTHQVCNWFRTLHLEVEKFFYFEKLGLSENVLNGSGHNLNREYYEQKFQKFGYPVAKNRIRVNF